MKNKKSVLVERLMKSRSAAPRGWAFPPEAEQDIREAMRVNASGEAHISRRTLALALKEQYKLPACESGITSRLAAMGYK